MKNSIFFVILALAWTGYAAVAFADPLPSPGDWIEIVCSSSNGCENSKISDCGSWDSFCVGLDCDCDRQLQTNLNCNCNDDI